MIETVIQMGDLLPQSRAAVVRAGEIEALAKDIKAHGLTHKVLVYDGVVLDGLKRIEALRHLKIDYIPVIVPNTLAEAAEALKDQRILEDSDDNNTVRAMDLLPALERLRVAWVKYRRTAAGQARWNKEMGGKGISTRQLLSIALGISPGRVEILQNSLTRATEDSSVRDLLEAVRRGSMSLYGIQTIKHRRKREALYPIVSADEVRSVWERGLRTLGTAIEAIGKFRSVDVVTLAERRDMVKHLDAQRVNISKIMKKINTSIREEMALLTEEDPS